MTREQLVDIRRRIAMAQRHLAEQEPYGRAWTAMISWIEALEAQVTTSNSCAVHETPRASWWRGLAS
jgi:hypothetical protein